MTLTPDDLRQAVVGSAALFPFAPTPTADGLRFIVLSEADYRHASFLDQRLVGPASRCGDIPWEWLARWGDELPLGCDFVFHVSHCGSTLLSRLLGEVPKVLALREPSLLRAAAHAPPDARLALLTRLWSRSFHPGQRPLVKATSHVNRIGEVLLTMVPDARAILMWVDAETFLAAVLDGSPGDIVSGAASRLTRLSALGRTVPEPLAALSPGETAAMSWLCERLTLDRLARAHPQRTLGIDFDRFLADMPGALDRVLDHLQLPAATAGLNWQRIVGEYSKRPGVPYDFAFRTALLERSKALHRQEIDRGLAWIVRHEDALR